MPGAARPVGCGHEPACHPARLPRSRSAPGPAAELGDPGSRRHRVTIGAPGRLGAGGGGHKRLGIAARSIPHGAVAFGHARLHIGIQPLPIEAHLAARWRQHGLRDQQRQHGRHSQSQYWLCLELDRCARRRRAGLARQSASEFRLAAEERRRSDARYVSRILQPADGDGGFTTTCDSVVLVARRFRSQRRRRRRGSYGLAIERRPRQRRGLPASCPARRTHRPAAGRSWLDAPFADAGGKPVQPVNQAVPGRFFHHGSFGRMALSLPACPSAVLPSATVRRAFIARPPCSAVVSSAPAFNSITSPATSFIRQVSKCSGRSDGGCVEAGVRQLSAHDPNTEH